MEIFFFGELCLIICDRLPQLNPNIFMESDRAQDNGEELIQLFFKILTIFLGVAKFLGFLSQKMEK